MWNSAREILPGLGQPVAMWPGHGDPYIAKLCIVQEAGGAHITVWRTPDDLRRVLHEGHFWIRLPDLPPR